MKIEIPNSLIQEALESHFIQDRGTIKSTEGRSREVERRAYHFHEIVMGLIINEYRRQKLLPYNKK